MEEVGRHQSLDGKAGALALQVDFLPHKLFVQLGLDAQTLGGYQVGHRLGRAQEHETADDGLDEELEIELRHVTSGGDVYVDAVDVHVLHAPLRSARRGEGGGPIRGGGAVGDVLPPGGPAVRGGHLYEV